AVLCQCCSSLVSVAAVSVARRRVVWRRVVHLCSLRRARAVWCSVRLLRAHCAARALRIRRARRAGGQGGACVRSRAGGGDADGAFATDSHFARIVAGVFAGAFVFCAAGGRQAACCLLFFVFLFFCFVFFFFVIACDEPKRAALCVAHAGASSSATLA